MEEAPLVLITGSIKFSPSITIRAHGGHAHMERPLFLATNPRFSYSSFTFKINVIVGNLKLLRRFSLLYYSPGESKTRTVYVNGSHVNEDEGKVSIFDRGFLFSDAVYEVTCVLNRKLVDFENHITRLFRSPTGLEVGLQVTREKLLTIYHKLIEKNKVVEGLVYLQVS